MVFVFQMSHANVKRACDTEKKDSVSNDVNKKVRPEKGRRTEFLRLMCWPSYLHLQDLLCPH